MPSVNPIPQRSKRLCGAYALAWLGRVDARLPELGVPGGTLVLAAHYNGAVDGFAYAAVLPPVLGVVSAQWHRWALGRALLPGVAVVRAKDGPASGAANLSAFRSITRHLAGGGRVLFFPEGTSRLGESRLPVQKGTLLLLRQLRRMPNPPRVCFASAHYHDPTLWRSQVSIAVGDPSELPADPSLDEAWVQQGLLGAQEASLSMPRRPSPIPRILAWSAALPYLPAWALSTRLAHKAADDPNVIALWKFIFGVPVTAAWLCALSGLAAWAGYPVWAAPLSLAAAWFLWRR